MLKKGQQVVEMQNLHGRFVQYYNMNNLESTIGNLFSKTQEVRLFIPEKGIDCHNVEEISEAMECLQNSRKKNPYGLDVMCLNTPGFSCNKNGNPKALWDAYIYEPTKDNQISYVIGHFDVEFVEENGKIKYKELIWNELSAMEPWECNEMSGFIDRRNLVVDSGYINEATPDDFVEIQKLQAKFSHKNRMDADKLFIEDGAVFEMSPLFKQSCRGTDAIRKKLEELSVLENHNGRFLAIPLISAPVIMLNNSGEYASAQWMCMCISVLGEQKDKENPVVYHIGRFNQLLKKQNGKWKFEIFRFEEICSFIPFHYSHDETSRYDRMSRDKKKWLYGTDPMGGTFAEDVFEIESIIPQWTYRLRSGDQVTILDEYLQSDYRDIYKSLRAFTYTRDYGEMVLRKYFIERQDASFDTSMPAFHTATTPWVEVNEEGTYAKAVWLDHSISDLFKGKLKEDRYRPYAAYIGKYEHEFVKENGKWKLLGIGWEPLITLPNFMYDTEDCRGWMDWNHKDIVYPKPFEKYKY